MIDHLLGRPSTKTRKLQVFAVLSFWLAYLRRGHHHGPPGARAISSVLSRRLTAWQTVTLTVLTLYISRNFGKLIGLECPEPLANLYSRAYFRATWLTTALDAGFWTAMRVRPWWLRDIASIIFTIYYIFAAEQADAKVRCVRAAGLTVEHMRVSWNKGTTPILGFAAKLFRPRLIRYPPRRLRIPRPSQSPYNDEIDAWLYFDGSLEELKLHRRLVLDIPGGGFIAMNPRTNDDKLFGWAAKTGVPVVSLDYKKAPEYPYPYALNECYDAYHSIVVSRGQVVGLSGEVSPTIVLAGDSAGGNLATGLTLMVLESGAGAESHRRKGELSLPLPQALILIYPSLDVNVRSFMTDEHISLIRDRDMSKTNRGVLRRKSEEYHRLTPAASAESLLDDDNEPAGGPSGGPSEAVTSGNSNNYASRDLQSVHKPQPKQLKTHLAITSAISYVNDRILTPEIMRTIILLYIGSHRRPDLSTDFLLSPVLAPESLLARFPKTYFLTGERDPLVDDTVIFAGLLRQAKLHVFQERVELGLESSRARFDDKQHVEVTLVPGVSHGFLQIVGLYPDGWLQVFRCAHWMNSVFAAADAAAEATRRSRQRATSKSLVGARKPQAHPHGFTVVDAQPAQSKTSQPIAAHEHGADDYEEAHHNDSDDDFDEDESDDDYPLEMGSVGARRRASTSDATSAGVADSTDTTLSAASASTTPPKLRRKSWSVSNGSPEMFRATREAAEKAEAEPDSVATSSRPRKHDGRLRQRSSPAHSHSRTSMPSSSSSDAVYPLSPVTSVTGTGRASLSTNPLSPSAKVADTASAWGERMLPLLPSLQIPKFDLQFGRGRGREGGGRGEGGEGENENEDRSGRRNRWWMEERRMSLTSLPSEEDLLGRRMRGLTGGLMGVDDEAATS